MLKRLALAFALLAAAAPAGRAGPLVADLSEHLVAITTGFTGAKVLLFGATDGDGKVVVVVQGPRESITVRRKERVVGVWANRDAVTFDKALSFYQVMASEEMDEWLPLALREAQQIGVEYLAFKPRGEVGPAMASDFHEALIRNKQRLGHYGVLEGKVSIIGDRLFRTDVFFPANVPTGIYTVEVFLVKNGEIKSAQKTPLLISKTGFEADVFRMAHDFSALYGIAALIIAIAAGLLANAVFWKR